MTPIRYIGLIPLTYLQRPAIGNLCAKFYQDSSKTARIVYIETNGQANGQANGLTYERTDRQTDMASSIPLLMLFKNISKYLMRSRVSSGIPSF